MSRIQSRTPEKKAEKPCSIDLKISMKILFHYPPTFPFLSSNPKILKAFLKTFPTKMKPTKCPAREKKMRQEKRKKREREKAKNKTAVSLLNPKTLSKFWFLRMPELHKLIFCIWIRRP